MKPLPVATSPAAAGRPSDRVETLAPDAAALDAPAGCPAADRDGARACAAPEEPSLLVHGWTRRFVGDPRMTEEATALYGSLGYEVMAIPLDPASADEACAGCAVTLRSFHVLYTRRPAV